MYKVKVEYPDSYLPFVSSTQFFTEEDAWQWVLKGNLSGVAQSNIKSVSVIESHVVYNLKIYYLDREEELDGFAARELAWRYVTNGYCILTGATKIEVIEREL